jgi:hypothetical protein
MEVVDGRKYVNTEESKELEMTEKSGARSQFQQPPPIFSLTTSSNIAMKKCATLFNGANTQSVDSNNLNA